MLRNIPTADTAADNTFCLRLSKYVICIIPFRVLIKDLFFNVVFRKEAINLLGASDYVHHAKQVQW